MIKMPTPKFIQEHRKLIKILKGGSKKQLDKEAKSQSKELKSVLKRIV